MAKVKTISTHNGTAWGTEYPIGADAINVDITNDTIDPADSATTIESLSNSDVIVVAGDTEAAAWTKFNKTRNRIASILNNFDPGGGGSASSVPFDITLVAADWSNFTQTISNIAIVTGNYWYDVAPDPDDYLDYSTFGVRADDVTVNGQITFYCQDVPVNDIVVHIVRTSTEV